MALTNDKAGKKPRVKHAKGDEREVKPGARRINRLTRKAEASERLVKGLEAKVRKTSSTIRAHLLKKGRTRLEAENAHRDTEAVRKWRTDPRRDRGPRPTRRVKSPDQMPDDTPAKKLKKNRAKLIQDYFVSGKGSR